MAESHDLTAEEERLLKFILELRREGMTDGVHQKVLRREGAAFKGLCRKGILERCGPARYDFTDDGAAIAVPYRLAMDAMEVTE